MYSKVCVCVSVNEEDSLDRINYKSHFDSISFYQMAAVLHLLGPCPMPLEPEYNCCMCSSLCMPKLIQQIFSSVFFYINNNNIME